MYGAGRDRELVHEAQIPKAKGPNSSEWQNRDRFP